MRDETKYKETAIGKIPVDWEVKKLGDLGSIISGLTYSPENVSDKNGLLVLRSSNIQDRQLFFEDNVYVNVLDGNYNPVIKNDILICVRNGSKNLIGKNTLITQEFEGVAFGAFMAIFRSDLNNYLFQIFGTNLYQKEIHKNLGATINSINGSELKQFKIPLPPLREQEKIAEILCTWDRAIQETGSIIKSLEKRNKVFAYSLLTGKKRVGSKANQNFHKTNLGSKYPLDWEITSVKDIFSERKEKSNNQEKYPLYSLTIEKGLTEKTERYERSFLLKNQESNEYKIIYPNDILFNPMNLRFGAIAKSNIDKVVSVSAYYNSIFKKCDKINLEYYEALFKTSLFINLYDRIAIGSLLEKKRVHLSYFLELEIPKPSLEEQNQIAEILHTAMKELQQYQQKLNNLKTQKKGLMQQLLTGKVRTV